MNPAFHWLVSGQVITVDKAGVEFPSRSINVMVITENGFFNRRNMANAQEALMGRFVKNLPQIRGRTIKDVVFSNINMLGPMTDEEFNEGFPPAAPKQELQS
jgi:hypothetical protein